jgi:glycosyltransferase involved in cell wall biosynthesis
MQQVGATVSRVMNVLFVIGRLHRGGAERQMVLLAAALQRRGHRVSIATLHGPAELDALADEHGVRVRHLARAGLLRSLRTAIALIALIRNDKPDVVHPYLPESNARVTLLKPFIRPARIAWGVRASELPWVHYRRRARLLWPLVVRLARWADVVVANSWAGAEFHVGEGFPAGRMRVVPNGIDVGVFVRDVGAGVGFRERVGLGVGVPVVGMLARFDPMKGHEDFVRVGGLVAERVPGVWLLVVGAHSVADRERMLGWAAECGVADRLVMVDASGEPMAALNAMDVLVVPSRFGEGFSNVIGEALACGVPVVATDVGDAVRIVDGRCVVVGVGDVVGMADGVVAELVGPRDDAGREALRVSIVERFGLEQLAVNTEAVLNDTVTGSTGR